MSCQSIVLLAPCPFHPVVCAIANGFGWSVERASSIAEAIAIASRCDVPAVLFQVRTLWSSPIEEVKLLRSRIPDAKPIVCHSFSDELDWPRLAVAGAYDALRLPFNATEVRRSLGFVWSAECRKQEALRRRAALRVVAASSVA